MTFLTAIGRFRIVAFVESLSFLLLVFVAMPLKYIWHQPQPVKILGSVHGGLFVFFALVMLQAAIEHRWKLMTCVRLMIYSFVPFGPWVLERLITRELAQYAPVDRGEAAA
jgi:integral membrane protein